MSDVNNFYQENEKIVFPLYGITVAIFSAF